MTHRPSLARINMLVVLALSLSDCSNPAPRTEQSTRPTPIAVQVVRVKLNPVDDTYESAGTVRAEQQAVISSKVMGTILKVLVKPGDMVRAGDPLVDIDDTQSKTQVRQAEALLSVAEKGIVEAEKSRESATADTHLAELTYQRYKQLLDKHSISPHEFDQVEAKLQSANAAKEMAVARVEEARAHREQATAAVDSAKTQLSYSQITSPISGLVVDKSVDPGTLAMPGAPLLVIQKASSYRLEAAVPELRVTRVKIGDSIKVSIPAVPMETVGHVVEIEPSTDTGSRAFLVKISIPGQKGIHGGMFGRALLPQGTENRLTVPTQSVLRDGQLNTVFVVTDSIARLRLITLGRTFGDSVEVLSGLDVGETVITSKTTTLTDGSPVETR